MRRWHPDPSASASLTSTHSASWSPPPGRPPRTTIWSAPRRNAGVVLYEDRGPRGGLRVGSGLLPRLAEARWLPRPRARHGSRRRCRAGPTGAVAGDGHPGARGRGPRCRPRRPGHPVPTAGGSWSPRRRTSRPAAAELILHAHDVCSGLRSRSSRPPRSAAGCETTPGRGRCGPSAGTGSGAPTTPGDLLTGSGRGRPVARPGVIRRAAPPRGRHSSRRPRRSATPDSWLVGSPPWTTDTSTGGPVVGPGTEVVPRALRPCSGCLIAAVPHASSKQTSTVLSRRDGDRKLGVQVAGSPHAQPRRRPAAAVPTAAAACARS